MFPGDGNGGRARRINPTSFGLAGPSVPFSIPHQQQSIDDMGSLLPPHPHHHHLLHHPPPQMICSSPASLNSGGSSSGGIRGNDDEEFPKRDERFPQWDIQETKVFIRIRIELDADFTATKRNKALWEVVSAKMREKGYHRTPDQCKSKWKHLIHKYKEMETIDPGYSSQFPALEGLNEFFAAREKQLLLNSEAGSSEVGKRPRTTCGDQSSEEIYEDEGKEIERDGNRIAEGSTLRRKKAKKDKHPQTTAARDSFNQPSMSDRNITGNVLNGIREMLQDFFQQQQKIEMQWMETMEKRARERLLYEQEWRQSMENLERERLTMERSWKDREEQRRTREENRADRRDTLLTELLNRLVHD